jgi:hypothetical protein
MQIMQDDSMDGEGRTTQETKSSNYLPGRFALKCFTPRRFQQRHMRRPVAKDVEVITFKNQSILIPSIL